MFRWFLLVLLILIVERFSFRYFPSIVPYTFYGFQILAFVLFVIEYYSFQTVRSLTAVRWIQIAYLVFSAIALAYIAYTILTFDRRIGQNPNTLRAAALLLLVYLPKIIFTLLMVGQDLTREIAWIVKAIRNGSTEVPMPGRRKFTAQIALGIAAVPFLSLLYGISEGKYHFKVRRKQIGFPDLPDAFDGFKILQISDVHSGSFDDPEKIRHAIDMINGEAADMMLFTGDIVNTHAYEMEPWIETFNEIKSFPYGKFACLGNHDYGEYAEWPSPEAKVKNAREIKELYGRIGFRLMLNEHRFITKGNDRIALVGVENWGRGFKQVGDLNKASEGLTRKDFKVLMSHDPSHWDEIVQRDPKHYQLTFSGHTHGLQFGIEIPGWFKWSPSQYIYKQWAGLYENVGRYLYVNRGFGFHAYPGRVGIWPEITVLELKKI